MIDVVSPKKQSELLDDGSHPKSIYARVPQVFGEPGVLIESDQQKIEDLQTLVNKLGTSAYKLYVERTEQRKRDDYRQKTDGQFLANQMSIKAVRSDVNEACMTGPGHKVYNHELSPRKAANSALLGTIPRLKPSQDDELMEVIMKFRNLPQRSERKANKVNYVIKHNGSQVVNQGKDPNIFATVASKILSIKDSQMRIRRQSNSYGISNQFLDKVDLESSRFVAVFMEDGKSVEESKAFKYNLSEKFHNF